MWQHSNIGSGWWTGLLLAIGASLIAGRALSQSDASAAGTHEGAPTAIGQGSARAFVTLGADGKPTTLGIRLTETALAGLPAEPPAGAQAWEYTLTLPAEAAGSGYDHLVVDWNPHGHEPPGVYDSPHFDFHFYLIDAKTRNGITAVGADLARAHKAPAEEHMPEGYALPPGTEVPRMGAHAIYPAGDEFNKQPFTRTFIYGFYDGQMIFVEPMVSRAFLETRPNISEPVKLPKAYTLRAYYPTGYGIRYDASQRLYEISLEGLVLR